MSEQKYSRDAVLILAASFCYMICPILTAPIIAGYAESMGGKGLLMGIIVGIMNMTSLICRPFAGNLADRIPKRRLAMMGCLFLLAGSCIYVFSPGANFLLIGRVLDGIGFASCSIAMSSWLASIVPPGKVGSSMGLYGTVQALGMAVAPPIGIFVSGHFGYRFSFLVTGACAILSLILVHCIRDGGLPIRKSGAAKKGFSILEKKAIPIALIIVFFTIPYYGNQSFLLTYVKAVDLHVNTEWYFTIYAVFLIILRVGLGKAFNTVPYRRFLFVCIISSILSLLCFAFMNGNVLLFAAALFMAGGYGIMCSVSQAAAITLAGEGKRGLGTSTYYIGLDLGMMLGPIIAGFIYGHADMAVFYPGMLICPAACILIYIFFRKPIRNA
ncbi:MAG: MFS transporter [Firmicutes bacterium]|nr:MFS transporter [Bacillota bacterium]